MTKHSHDEHERICETRTGPQTRMGMFFVYLKYFLWKPLFFANLTTSGRVFLTEIVKRHNFGQRLFIWAYNLVSMTLRSKVLARTSSSLEKPLVVNILANWTTSGQVCLTEMVKKHIYWPRPFILAYNQVSMTFRSKVLARTRKRWQTDGRTDRQTDRHPNSIGPQLWGWGLIKRSFVGKVNFGRSINLKLMTLFNCFLFPCTVLFVIINQIKQVRHLYECIWLKVVIRISYLDYHQFELKTFYFFILLYSLVSTFNINLFLYQTRSYCHVIMYVSM